MVHQIASSVYALTQGCGGILTLSGGDIVAVVGPDTSTDSLAILSDFLSGTATVDDSDTMTTVFGSAVMATVDAAIDSNDVIHIVALAQADLSGNEIRYATATQSGGTYTIGSWETAGYYEDYDTGIHDYVSIAVDSNDKPHIVYVSDVTQAGATEQQIMYVEKTGASWSTPAQLSTRGTKTYGYSACRIDIWNNGTSDVIEVAYIQYIDLSNDPFIYQTKVGAGSWSGENTWSSYYVETIPKPHLVVDSSNNVYRHAGRYAVTSPSDYIENDVDTGINSPGDDNITYGSRMTIGIYDDTRYMFFHDPTPDWSQIQYSYYTGSGWSTPADAMADLAFTPDHIIAAWSGLNHVEGSGIHLLIDDAGDIYYHFFSLGATAASDSQSAYLVGGIVSTDNQPAYTEGQGSTVFLQPGVIELTGSVTPGTDQVIQLQPGVIELSGRIIFPVSPNAGTFDNWLNDYTVIDGVPGVSYDDGFDLWVNAETPLKTKPKPKKPKKVDIDLGAGVVELDGPIINVAAKEKSSKAAFLEGVAAASDTLSAYLAGGGSLADSQPAYMLAIGEWLIPDGTVTQSGSWKRQDEVTTQLHLSLDETDPNDTDYVYHADVTGNEYFEVTLSDPSWASVGDGDVTIYWRGERLEGTNSTDIRCELRQGNTVIASDTQTFTDDPTTRSFTLTAPEKANITDWTNLRLRFVVESVT